MMILNNPVIQKIVLSLCWTLIHSLWQGLVLASLAGVVLMLTRKSRPSLRYNVLTALLFLFALASGYTFCVEWNAAVLSARVSSGAEFSKSAWLFSASAANSAAKAVAGKDLIVNELISFLNINAHWIVVLWFVVFSLKSLKAASGIFYVNQIRTRSIHEVEEKWLWHLRQLAQKIGLYDRVGLVASEIVTVPMVTGFIRPMIIVPIGFLTDLPLSQVEAILLHELAHVKRSDYLVNLLQSFGEIFFFFNPAVLWLSSLIRQEREHCCDDLAINVLDNKSAFVNALVSFQEYNLSLSDQAVAFAGKRNHLLDRIKRIIYNNNKQLNAMEKLFVTASVIIAVGLSVAFSPAESVENLPGRPKEKMKLLGNQYAKTTAEPKLVEQDNPRLIHSELPASNDTLPKLESRSISSSDGFTTMDFNRDGKKYNVVTDGGEIIYLKIDGKAIAKEDMSKYKPEIGQMLVEVKQAHADAEVSRNQAEAMRKHADEARAQADGMRKQAEEMRAQANENKNQNQNLNIDSEKLRIEAEELRKGAEQMRKQTEGLRKQAEEMRLDADKQKAEAEKMRQQADQHREKADVMRKEAEKMRVEYEKMQEDFIAELTNEGIISGRANLSYKLSGDELIVNGKKQPDALQKRLKAKFLKTPNVEIVYNLSGKTGYTTTGLIYSR